MSKTSCRDGPIALSTRKSSSGSMGAFFTNSMLTKLAEGQVGYVVERHCQADGAGVAMSLPDDKILRTVTFEARIDRMLDVMVVVGPGWNFAFFSQAA